MENLFEVGVEVREDVMVPPTGDAIPTKKLAHFLKPTLNSTDGSVFELPSHTLADLPATFEPKRWSLRMTFTGWRSPQDDWKAWVEKMAALHEYTWKKAGILEAVLNSAYKIHRSNNNLILGLAERWCPETKSFIFSWGEATITLEDLMIAGYSVLGFPVYSPLETYEMKELEEKLNEARMELTKSKSKKADHGQWMTKFMDCRSEIEHEAFLAMWLSRFVFPGPKSAIVKSVFPIAIHLARGTRIALAPAILACIYRDLGSLKEKIVALTDLDSGVDEDSELSIIIRSPFQLVQIWAWERFLHLRPEPNLIKAGEPRFARWHAKTIFVHDVRRVLLSAKEYFDWRPYVKPVKNWNFPKFYGEKEVRVSVDPNLSEELLSFAQCLRISELVSLDCIEQYLPHRVAMQFGMDQDLPTCVARANESPYIAWNYYSKPISYILYIPCRFNNAEVTIRYSEWWSQSISRLQGASKCSITGTENIGKIVKGKKEADTASSFKAMPNKLKGTTGRNFMTMFEMTPEASKGKQRDINAFVVCGGLLKKAKKSVETSKEKNTASDASNSAGIPSEMPPLNFISKMEANDSPVPPGFPPKSDVVETRERINEDNMTISDLLKFNKTHDDLGNRQVSNWESLLPSQSRKFSSSIAYNEAINIIQSQTRLAEKIMHKEPVRVVSEATREHVSETKAGSPDHCGVGIKGGEGDGTRNGIEISDMQHVSESKAGSTDNDVVRIQWGEGDGNRNGIEISDTKHVSESKVGSTDNDVVRIQWGEGGGTKNKIEISDMQLEDQVSQIERIIAKLKEARFGHK